MDVTFEMSKNSKDEWLTPPRIIKALGKFDLDPCAPIVRPWDTAKNHFTINDNGLEKAWNGRVWCNPPYGKEAIKWLARCAGHKNCIALIFARTETKMFFDYVWNEARAVFFIKGRLSFYHVSGKPSGTAGAPSVLVAYNLDNAIKLLNCGLKGKYLSV